MQFANPNEFLQYILNYIGFLGPVIDYADQLFDSRLQANSGIASLISEHRRVAPSRERVLVPAALTSGLAKRGAE